MTSAECHECGGAGEFPYAVRGWDTAYAECQECGGTGVVYPEDGELDARADVLRAAVIADIEAGVSL